MTFLVNYATHFVLIGKKQPHMTLYAK